MGWRLFTDALVVVIVDAPRQHHVDAQEKADASKAAVVLGPDEYAVNEPGTRHTGDIEGEATAVFITSGLGTQHRARD